ncbi:MAG: 3-dehydroquinate synthase II [Candidatus Lokiarchaeota archaeon]|nr:3-dehydroquinate synthase II [Candidatus Lokiarchaeota archaeon]
MKKIILNFENKLGNFKELVQEAFNKDILNFLISKETYSELRKIERVNLYTKDMSIPANSFITESEEKLKELLSDKKSSERAIGFYKELKTKEDERAIVNLSRGNQVDFIIVSARDWKIIPFENLIAEMHNNDTDLIAEVSDTQEAELMLRTMEIGVDGILILPKNVNEIIELKNLVHITSQIELTTAKIINIEIIPEAERVCVDTTSLLNIGEGLLVGSTAAGFCLVHSETFETQFVASRPFRVNAGDVSAYVLVPDDDPSKVYRTKYLSELKGGDKVLAVTSEGEARIVSIGRVKIETRPMLRFELEVSMDGKKIPISCICQNAETIRLVGEDGKAKIVVDIKIGDEVLVHIGPGATHFGTAIKETIIEK